MTPDEAYAALLAHVRRISALEQTAGLLAWDQETMMPRGAAAQRAEESAAMQGVLHARRSDPRIADWLAAAEAELAQEDTVARAQLREIRRGYERTLKVPAALAMAVNTITPSEVPWAWT